MLVVCGVYSINKNNLFYAHEAKLRENRRNILTLIHVILWHRCPLSQSFQTCIYCMSQRLAFYKALASESSAEHYFHAGHQSCGASHLDSEFLSLVHQAYQVRQIPCSYSPKRWLVSPSNTPISVFQRMFSTCCCLFSTYILVVLSSNLKFQLF